jgi:nucleotidyltransferase substrate binding protein (TIGR01987 family)
MALPEKRWIQRFDNYGKALRHLENFVALKEDHPLSVVEEFAIIKTFELTFESAWNMLKDFLVEKGQKEMFGSRDVIRNAFRVDLIENGEVWMDMIKSRNNASHAYDEKKAKEILFDISNKYLQEFRTLKLQFEKYRSETEE